MDGSWQTFNSRTSDPNEIKRKKSHSSAAKVKNKGVNSIIQKKEERRRKERQKKMIVTLVSFKAKLMCQKNKAHFILIKDIIHNEDVKFMSLYSNICLK